MLKLRKTDPFKQLFQTCLISMTMVVCNFVNLFNNKQRLLTRLPLIHFFTLVTSLFSTFSYFSNKTKDFDFNFKTIKPVFSIKFNIYRGNFTINLRLIAQISIATT